MEKALKLLKILRDDYIHGELDKDINEAIAELEAINLTRREWYQKGFNEAMKHKTCKWHKEDDEDWRGECGCVWGFNGENPTKAEAYFCPQCGGKIIEIDMGDNKWQENKN